MGMAQIAVVDGTKIPRGAGATFFDLFSPAGAKQGFEFMGNVPKLDISGNATMIDKRTSVDPTNAIIATAERERSLELNLDFSEWKPLDLIIALFGKRIADYTQTNTPIVGEQLSASSTKGRVYFTAKRKVTAYTVKDDGVSKTEGTDYEIDTETGAVLVKASGTIADGSVLTIDYTPTTIAAGTLAQIPIGAAGKIEGEFRFVGNPVAGQIHEVILWKVQFNPAGALQYISEEFTDTPLKGRILADLVNHPNEPYGTHYIRTV